MPENFVNLLRKWYSHGTIIKLHGLFSRHRGRSQKYGKEFEGKGTRQRYWPEKRKLYYARCVDRSGKRLEKCFSSLTDARNWQKEQNYFKLHTEKMSAQAPEQKVVSGDNDLTVNEWFELWHKTMLVGLAYNTRRNYRERYEKTQKRFLEICVWRQWNHCIVKQFLMAWLVIMQILR